MLDGSILRKVEKATRANFTEEGFDRARKLDEQT